MNRRLPAAMALVTAAAITLGAGAVLAARGGQRPPRPPAISLTVSGDIDGLFPGADLTIPVRITNPYRFAIRVASVDVDVANASPSCPGSVLTTGTPLVGSSIAGAGSAVIEVPVAMSSGAPDACQGAVFALSYTATATRDR